MITAPYNFVPLNKEVFYPDWAEDVSHDVPFEDGESGEIDITITAKSPIFIRDHANPEHFCQYNGHYYIPSTSIKGMVRNVLEIMSCSKMRLETFDDDTYAVRDLSKADNFYMSEMKKPTFGGWLKKEDGKYFIEDCGEVGRIKHEEIDKALGIAFSKHFKSHTFDATIQAHKSSEYKSSKYKYYLVDKTFHEIPLSNSFKSQTNAKYDNRVFYNFDKNGTNKATLVLTGQPTPRKDSGKKGDGKGFEFLFFASNKTLEVKKEVFDNFKFAYFDKRTTEPKESLDWSYWKKKLEDGEKVPVFFQKSGNEIKHFGLSYLYKLPYSHSVKDGIPASHFESEKLDLSQTIFGYISKNNKEALKGRVYFSHFKATSKVTVLDKRTEILGTPRASYYPIYVRQQEGKLYSTFMNDWFEIAGRKRYPIHNSKTEDTGNSNVGTSFTPLKEGVVFQGKMRYHNLKKAELGALLSALTFHATPQTFHNIGLAKSLGYGKIALQLKTNLDIQNYLKEFEFTMEEQIPEWSNLLQFKELLSMSIEQTNLGNAKLAYMSLREFAENKTRNNQDYLRFYTSLYGIKTIQMNSFLTQEDKDALLVKREEIKQKRLKEQEFESALSSKNIQIIQNFIELHPNHSQLSQLQSRIEDLEKVQQETQFVKVNEDAQKAFTNANTQKDKNKRNQWLQAWLKKWEDPKNNKGSTVILELIEKAKQELT